MNFSEIIGQSAVKARLINSAKNQRISHALLFLGQQGTGNLPLALAFAQYMVCENPGEDDSCGICSSCKKMNKLIHPDVTFSFPVAPKDKITKPKSIDFIDIWRTSVLENPYLDYNDWMQSLDLENKQGLIAVHESADIIHRLSLRSAEGSNKIVIMWLPERMNTEAANKLLKILEEPPEDTFFLLVSSDYDHLMSTLISRVQLVKVPQITEAELEQAITERFQISADKAHSIAHLAAGNYNEALKILHHSAEEDDVMQSFLVWMRNCLTLNVKAIGDMASEMSKAGRENHKNFIVHALRIIRECLIINYGDRALVMLNGKDLEAMKKFAPFVNEKNASQFSDELNNAYFHLERNGNWRIVFTDLSFSIHNLLQIK